LESCSLRTIAGLAFTSGMLQCTDFLLPFRLRLVQFVVDSDTYFIEYLDTHVLELELNRLVALCL
jgi:hypothetical protein